MHELIESGVRQGVLCKFVSGTKDYDAIVEVLKYGRAGDARLKGVGDADLFLMLTQDCGIADRGAYVELAQLKKIKVEDEQKVHSLMLGKDYKKLIVKVENDYYELIETLITKIKKQNFLEALKLGVVSLKSQLSSHEKRIVLDWRLLTYYREPFPDKFNRILFEYLDASSYWFVNFLIEKRDCIHSVRMYVDPENDENAPEYKLIVSLLITPKGETCSEEITENLIKMLQELDACDGIISLQLQDLDYETIDLPEYAVMAYTITLDEFTFANAYVMREFNFQYLCY